MTYKSIMPSTRKYYSTFRSSMSEMESLKEPRAVPKVKPEIKAK